MRLLLTGATGFVGRNLLMKVLRSERYSEVVAVVRDRPKLEAQLQLEEIPADRLRIVDWKEAIPDDVDHAVHCAGVLFARYRDDYFRVNVTDALRILSSFQASTRVVALSSQSAAGPTPPGRRVRTASDPDRPITWYGESKLEMERRLRAELPNITIWRPPMILGARDHSTLSLFKMSSGLIRLKPGFAPKAYSWISVSDLTESILNALNSPDSVTTTPLDVCMPDSITDLELITTAARLVKGRGVTVRLPKPLVALVSAVVDRVPSFREVVPSLTRDRVREMAPDRWVVDGSEFQRRFAPTRFENLQDTLKDAHDWCRKNGLLP